MLRLLAALFGLALSACLGPRTIVLSSPDASRTDAWELDAPVPVDAPTVWSSCLDALADGHAGDPCSFTDFCTEESVAAAACEEGVLLWSRVRGGDGTGTCTSDILFSGACATVRRCGPSCEWFEGTACQDDLPAVDPTRPTHAFPDTVAFQELDPSTCDPLVEARLGDPCTGVGGCVSLLVPEASSHILVWCDGLRTHRQYAYVAPAFSVYPVAEHRRTCGS